MNIPTEEDIKRMSHEQKMSLFKELATALTPEQIVNGLTMAKLSDELEQIRIDLPVRF